MSVISEQVKELREKAQVFEDSGCATNGIVKTFREAADTIEELSAKLADVNMERSTAYYNNGWIPCSDPRRPKNGQRVVITTDLMKGMNYINTAYYYTEKPKPWWEDEWDGEGFYQSHECGYCRREDVTAWFAVEPYKGVE